MLLYHFPLTSNSTTANFENRGMRKDYTIGGVGAFVSGGKLSAYCLSQSTSGATFTISTFTNNYSLCMRVYITTNANICTIGGAVVYSSLVGITNAWCDIIIQGGKLYVNGSYKSALTYSNGTLVIGGSYSGRLQDLRIYDYCLSPQEIADYSKALVLHYTLNGSVSDCSGIGYNYTKISGKTYNYYSNSPRSQKYLSTNDTNVKAVTTTAPTNNKSMWCKYSGVWYHLYSNGKYVNGVVNTTLYDTIYNNATELSDLRIYATALSSTDILALYNTPITLGQSLNCVELKENTTYNENAWRTPTYAEMYYILNTRTNASSLRGLGRIQTATNTYVNGCFLLPDGFTAPSGITFTNTTSNYTTNTYTLTQWQILEDLGVVFLCFGGCFRSNTTIYDGYMRYWFGTISTTANRAYCLSNSSATNLNILIDTLTISVGAFVRLVQSSQLGKFSTPNGKINFACGNLQYHCTQHIWRFAPNQYDYIGSANANISDSYNGWIDLFGYGTSGVNYSPTLHTTTNSDYASGNIEGTDNDWGVNSITSAEYMAENIRLTKNGIIKANELNEGSNQLSKNGIQYTRIKEN